MVMVPEILQAAVIRPMMSMTSITISESLMEPQLLEESSLMPLPIGMPCCLSALSPRIVNSKRPISRAHTMECPVISITIMLPMNNAKAITRLIR